MSLGDKLRSVFDDPFREVRAFGVEANRTVADVGAGLGYFTVAAAEVVGPEGLVYSIEPDVARYEKIVGRTETEGLSNVRVVNAKAEDLNPIPDGSVDIAFTVNAMHHFDDKNRALVEIRRVLRNGGSLYIRDIIRGLLIRHGTRRKEVGILSEAGFSKVEILEVGRYLKARLTK
jgi:ubiquinone/menaquinone biosynthesis C-methylase UbiE